MRLLVFSSLASTAFALTIRQDSNTSTATNFTTKCLNFRPNNVTNVTFANVTYYAANASVYATSPQQTINTTILPAFCRVAFYVNTTAASAAFSELWLPDSYNGRLMGTGNGGWAGGVAYGDVGFLGTRNGFAMFGTNTGHDTNSANTSWGVNNPEAVLDFGISRALAQTTIASKTMVRQYYGSNATRTYYSGCSTGGRQGFQLATLYPDLFDGIIAGAPANWWTHLLLSEAYFGDLVRPINSTQWISASLWNSIATEVLRQCDSIDGVADGVLQDPKACAFRPEAMSCKQGATDTSACLNPAQIAVIKKIYSPWTDSLQNLMFPGLNYGTENSNPSGLFGVNPFIYAMGELMLMGLVNDTNPYNASAITVDTVKLADQLDPGRFNTINPDLRAFQARGGKILHYHGLADRLIAPDNSVNFRNSIDQFFLMNTNVSTDSFYRFFQVPGMDHCYNGAGANVFGQAGAANVGSFAVATNPQNDITSAMLAWVEQGIAPENFTASHYVNNTRSQGVAFQRTLCKYPARSIYTGGNTSLASSWGCV